MKVNGQSVEVVDSFRDLGLTLGAKQYNKIILIIQKRKEKRRRKKGGYSVVKKEINLRV